MKYRVRDTSTGKLVKHGHRREDMLLLSPCGTRILMYKGSELYRLSTFKPEFEVTDGVYEGDYLLLFPSGVPRIYHIETFNKIRVLGCDTFYQEYVKSFLRGLDYEVIKCRE